MKAKNRMRKLVAFICIATMLVSSYGFNILARAEEYREVTFRDFGMNDETYRDSAEGFGQATQLTGLDNVAFEGTVMFGDENGDAPTGSDILVFGDGTNNCAGLQLYCNGDVLMVVDGTGSYTDNYGILCGVDESIAGGKLANTPVKIRLTFDYVNNTDVKLGVYVNEAECFNDFISGLASVITPGIYLWAGSTSITVQSKQEEQPKEYDDVSFRDFGMDDTTYRDSAEGFGQATELTDLDGVAFEGTVQFGDENGAAPTSSDLLVFGDGTNNCAGLQMYYHEGSLVLADGTGAYGYGVICGVDEATSGMQLANIPVKIRLTFDYVNNTDVKLGVYVNEAECFNDVISGVASVITPGIYLWAGSTSITITSTALPDEPTPPTPPTQPTPVEFTTVGFDDFGLENNKIYRNGTDAFGQNANSQTLHGLAIEGTVTFGDKDGDEAPTSSDAITFGHGTGSGAGLQIYYHDSGLYLLDGTGSVTENYGILANIDEETAGRTLKNSPIEIRMTFQYVGDTDVWVTFSVYGVEYYSGMIQGLGTKLTPEIYLWAGTTSITLGDPDLREAITYENITFGHFGIENGTYPVGSEFSGQMTGVDSLDGYAFEGTLSYGATSVEELAGNEIFVIGGKEYWSGLQVYHNGSGLMLVDASQEGTEENGWGVLCVVSNEEVEKTFVNTPFDIRLCFKYENDSDVRLGFWVDGVEYYNEIVKGLAERIEPKLLIYAGALPLTIKSSAIPIILKPIDFAEFGLTEKWAYTLRLK